LEQAFIEVIRRLFNEKEGFINTISENIKTSIHDDITDKIGKLEVLIAEKSKYMLEINDKYREAAISREEYVREFETASLDMDVLIKKKKDLLTSKLEFVSSKVRLDEMKKFLEKTKDISEFDGDLLINLVDRIKVMSKHSLIFEFKCGFEYEMNI
jgi:hypothetical protein